MISESRTIWWDNGIKTIDQTRLPAEFVVITIRSIKELVNAITSLKIRGAPALGAAGGYGIALAAMRSKFQERDGVLHEMEIAAEMIKNSRPTAVNLSWGVDRVLRAAQEGEIADEVREIALREAERIAEEDLIINKMIGRHGAKLLNDGDSVLTHCNAGRLACVGWGTALGVIRQAVMDGKEIHVYACETRPLNQGSRLTSWELMEDNIDVTLVCDSASGILMRRGMIDSVIVGADRITRDAVFNKIGTYTHAVLAKAHGIPFYVAAPLSTFDASHDESEIVIEERDGDELRRLGVTRLAPDGVKVYNPAFDATPIDLVSAMITEKGVFRQPLMPPGIL
ncbi:MAG: S-methyl-5-thioribose-1-phosphate isomerase [Methanothrix sp.]|uniref:Putative methylthioribose-1-phosphate isomerase n=1 Tax=Methanothrix thermoacetophila (strain DSM 6194 / JCM 14653 / NBRC 101360 / PT) TaxID=349307 RepID=A0B634_METTP|nr:MULTISPECIES: S-methyl-5-thioribose-1-phosphate isomerase [Methanothrix]ABK14158.1 translation initiation factor 2B subunit I family (IF-2BI) [Methanothrix thermoacetophila PT]MBC7079743.1 S-methyl-5-thioribose-1-phosphate isomerase [Methanothrix sp.]NPU87818.1 S-methyl-5-thioribose-1-phosphate isomerase [Methanothrix sp.]